MYIQLRNHTYHFRFVVPPAYRAIVGKQEIRQSLKTGNKRIAQHKAIVLAGQVIAELEEISSAPVLPVTGAKLSEIFGQYLQEKRLQGLREGTFSAKRLALKSLIQVLGDKPLAEYGRVAAKRYRDVLLARRSGAVSVATVNNRLKNINAFCHWAMAEGHSSYCPFEKLTVRDERKPSEIGKAYTREHLAFLFSPSRYKFPTSSYKYWLPMLALHTGARLKELAQLYVDDIEIINGIACIHIRALHDDQHLKNKASKRIVPIHSSLVEPLLEHVTGVKQQGAKRLFPDISYHKVNGYAGSPSRWWGRYNSLEGYTFHSFRHTVANELKQLGVEEKYIAALLGHSYGSITHNRYGKDYKPELLKAIVEKLAWGL